MRKGEQKREPGAERLREFIQRMDRSRKTIITGLSVKKTAFKRSVPVLLDSLVATPSFALDALAKVDYQGDVGVMIEVAERAIPFLRTGDTEEKAQLLLRALYFDAQKELAALEEEGRIRELEEEKKIAGLRGLLKSIEQAFAERE